MPLLKSFKELKASSLVESVVAISIISICALVAFLVYLNIVKQSKSVHYYNAKHQVEFLAHESVKQQNYEEDIFQFNGYTITKNVSIDKEEQTVFLAFIIKTGNSEHQINKLITYYEF